MSKIEQSKIEHLSNKVWGSNPHMAQYFCNVFILLLLLMFSIPLMASDFKSGERVSIDQPVVGDLYIAAEELRLNAPIDGDLVATGGKIWISDSIYQDLIIAGGELIIKGFIGDDLRAAGGRITISSVVEGDLVVFGGEIEITDDAVIEGDLVVYGGNVQVNGSVKGSIRCGGGNTYFGGVGYGDFTVKGGDVEINGEIRGKSKLLADGLILGSNARFLQNVEYWSEDGEKDFESSLHNADATFNSDLKYMDDFGEAREFSWGRAAFYVLTTLLNLILLNIFFNKSLEKAANNLLERPLKCLGFGALYVVGLPLFALILLVTVIGIPLGLVLLTVLIFSLVFGLSVAAVVAAKYLKLRYNYQQWTLLIMILVSAASFAVFKLMAQIPWIGWLCYTLIVAMAFGAILHYIWYQKRKAKVALGGS